MSAASWERPGVVGMDALAMAKPARFVPRQPGTILRWHRAGFRAYWRWKSRGQSGRPKVSVELRKSSIASDLTYDLRTALRPGTSPAPVRISIRFIAISCSSPTCALPPTLMSQIGQQCRQANESRNGLSDDICGTASHKIDTKILGNGHRGSKRRCGLICTNFNRLI